ncbi:MAG TPA: hypothetical protein VE988_26135, partial [Gemmataceae bacterium]|nr:hypothetical protein [Gemmataceae bacterium]
MHDHSHDTDTYYLDQLCMVGITGAFAGICLTLYFFNTDMLKLLLQDDFHPLILAAGVTLLIVTLVRAAVLWRAAGKKSAAHVHDHAHEHHHHDHAHDHHDHAHCDHDHHHEHVEAHDHHHHHGEACGHDHHHEHIQPAVATYHSPALPMVAHDHGHAHDSDDGHDHGWAPWRYVVLLVPMMLFLLGLPNKAMPLGNPGTGDVSQEAAQAARLVGLYANPLSQASYGAALLLQADDRVAPIFVDNNQVSVGSLEPGMKVWLKLVVDDKVVGKKGVKEVWATRDSGSPAASKDVPWTPMGVVKKVNAKENTLTVAPTVDSQAEETFDLEATVYIEFKQLEQIA